MGTVSRFFTRLVRSGRLLRNTIGWIALMVVPILLMLVVIATKFQGLRGVAAMDQAQVARHLAAGDGFVTSLIRPLSVVFKPELAHHPDLYNAPVYPLALSVFFRAFGSIDKVVAGAGAAFWLLSVWLTFLVARAWLSRGVAVMAAAFYLCNVAMISVALGGLPQPLMAISILLAFLLLFPNPRGEENVEEETSGWRIGLAGAICGVAVLTHYLLVMVAIGLAVYVLTSAQRKGRALLLFALGFVLSVSPWMWRNFRETGSPVFGLYRYEVLAGTASYPGESLWRTMELPANPVSFIFQNPRQIIRKLAGGFAQLRGAMLDVVDPLVGFLFLAGLMRGSISRRWRALLVVVTASVGLTVAGSWLLRPEPGMLLGWMPLFAIVAAAQLSHWVDRQIDSFSFEGIKIPLPAFGETRRRREHPKIHFGRFNLSKRASRVLVYVAVVLWVVFPVLFFLLVSRPGLEPQTAERVNAITNSVGEQATVMTDQPAVVAWYTNRKAVWLCQGENGLDELQQLIGSVDAFYITPSLSQMAITECGDWWPWVSSPQGVYRGFSVREPAPVWGVLRTRVSEAEVKESTPPEKATNEVTRLRAEVAGNPGSADARLRLAGAYLKQDRLREAAEEYREVARLDPQDASAVLGVWHVLARLKDSDNTIALTERAARLNPKDPQARIAIAEAATTLERALVTRPDDLWLLLQAALCDAKLKRWEQAEVYLRRASDMAPKAFSPRLMLGNLYLEEGLVDEASAALEKLVQEQPANAMALEALGKVRWFQGRFDQALEEFIKAQRARPDWPAPYLQAALVCVRLNRFTDAVGHFQKALELSPHSLAALLGLAEAFVQQGKETLAIPVYEKVLVDFPTQPIALNNLANIYANANQNIERALDLARKAVTADPNNGAMKDTLGWVCYRAGLNDEAIAQLQEAVRSGSDQGSTYYRLGKALLVAKRRQEAVEAFRTALLRGLPPEEKRDAEALLVRP